MNSFQKKSLDKYQLQLTEAITFEAVAAYMQQRHVISKEEVEAIKTDCTEISKVLKLLDRLKTKGSGWDWLLEYLRYINTRSLADKLMEYANEKESDNSGTNRSELDEFSDIVAEYYQSSYSYVQSFDRDSVHVKDFWIPVEIEEEKRSGEKMVSMQHQDQLLQQRQAHPAVLAALNDFIKTHFDELIPFQKFKTLDVPFVPVEKAEEEEMQKKAEAAKYLTHANMLSQLIKDHRNVVIVKGEPGMGKTALVKKLAFDWSESHLKKTKELHQFKLVLAVPLRFAGSQTNFIDMAVSFLLKTLQIKHLHSDRLIANITAMGTDVLLCFDGLDEYQRYLLATSPFKRLFAAPFESPTNLSDQLPPYVRFKMVITSRPYACEQINADFHPLKFRISGFGKENLQQFVQLYCQPKSLGTVMEYLNTDFGVKRISEIPLIIMIICYLADRNEAIPNQMALLYERCVHHMLIRARNLGKLGSALDTGGEWRKAAVIKVTAQLAYLGAKKQQLSFSESEMHMCGIGNDSFVAGFLLQKFDFHNGVKMCDFPHRSIQDFFAALHCFELLETSDDSAEENWIAPEIFSKDSQLGRFLSGLYSEVNKFPRFLSFLSRHLDKMVWSNFGRFMSAISAPLADLSNSQMIQIGCSVYQALEKLEKAITTPRTEMFTWPNAPIENLNLHIQTTVGIKFVMDETNRNWLVPTEGNEAMLVNLEVDRDLSSALDVCQSFKRINLLLLRDFVDLSIHHLEFLKHLPPVRTLVAEFSCGLNAGNIAQIQSIAAAAAPRWDINVSFTYENPPPADLIFQHFTLRASYKHLDAIRSDFCYLESSRVSSTDENILAGVTAKVVSVNRQSNDGVVWVKLHITNKRHIPQFELIVLSLTTALQLKLQTNGEFFVSSTTMVDPATR